MKQQICRSLLFLFFFSVFLLCFSKAAAYKNDTVGDSLGWYDKLQKPTINYQKWAAGKNFSLGDFLIFNTDTNHSVIQTYNITTYKACDYDNAEDDDTIQWATGEPAVTTQAVSIAVPLLKEGMTYFFSGDYDGEQCKNGQHFKINVTHGQGLPNSLKSPSTDSSPAPSSSAEDDSVPDTVIPSNFNNPVGGDEVKQASGSISLVKFLCGEGGMLTSVVVCLGLVWAFG
ncbi:hypothetical protein MRB53_009700 [Persea americana]|uniref:Uncharacterized protein n=1 Tax=Persea americana TaxID=3435 RepID=A0ACC2LQG3_PERAE|nr:hypothetical protein MRB53_009700 [Persea americana]|eukprot:TRINITY_DN12193_c0_g2_i1.p1 TRINITY_DN12193_c0_g2~~TRINITY_DN12193_c0_g2_i1.p1  ORF type:complete len:229 (-),score=45.62 TRINITY_DN12193_c0_g2_i1:296-982(-)